MTMGWPSTNNAVKPESEKAAEAEAAAVQDVEVNEPPSLPPAVVYEIQRAEIMGTARIFASWPMQLARAVLWLLLGALLGVLFALVLRMVIPMVMESSPEPEHLHMATSNLTAPRACALEALAREHAQRPCNLVLLRAHPAKTIHLVYLLRNNYPNLNTFYHPDPDDYFESSPLDGMTRFGASGSLLELAARTLALWRHGGVSVDLDRPVMHLPPTGQYIQQGHGALLQFPQPCHPALQGLLSAMGHDLQGSAEDAMTRATSWMCRIKLGADEEEELEEPSTTAAQPKPEQCLGVNVLDNEELGVSKMFCPVVQAHHEEIISTTTAETATEEPVTEISEDLE